MIYHNWSSFVYTGCWSAILVLAGANIMLSVHKESLKKYVISEYLPKWFFVLFSKLQTTKRLQ